eukprot:2433417-Pyramimonas_sp.AAC.1
MVPSQNEWWVSQGVYDSPQGSTQGLDDGPPARLEETAPLGGDAASGAQDLESKGRSGCNERT